MYVPVRMDQPTQPISAVSEPVTVIGHFQGSRGFLLG